MTEVKRFNVFTYLDDDVAELDINHDPEGTFVLGEDYDKLRTAYVAELDVLSNRNYFLRKENQQLQLEIEQLRQQLNKTPVQ
jgi:hypothetical protein